MRIITLLFAFLTGAATLYAQPRLNQYQSYQYHNGVLVIKAANGLIEVEPYSAGCIKVTYKKNIAEQVVSYSTIGKNLHPKSAVTATADDITLSTSKLRVNISKADLSVHFLKGKQLITEAHGYQDLDTLKTLSFELDDHEAIYGGGSKAIAFNRRGSVLQNYNQAHYGYQSGQTDLNIAIPLLISNRLYALYFDNYGEGWFDVGKSNQNQLTFGTESGLMSFFLISGDNNDEVLSQYTRLTGKQPLPPRWALGYIQSRYGYKSQQEVMEVAAKTRKAGMPLDALVLDLYWYGGQKVMGNHNWDPKMFPQPVKMMSDLRKQGIKIIPISETFITQQSENFAAAKQNDLLTHNGPTAEPYIIKNFWAGPAALLDIFKPQAQQFYWHMYRDRIKQGVGGWWFDLGEPETHPDSMQHVNGPAKNVHNVYALTWANVLYNGYRREFPRQRVFNLIRSGYAGMQRYSVFPWSGDISRSWSGLRAQIPIMMGMGFSGVGYTHFDAGGFTGGPKDPELYTRWLELASFVPVMRAHGEGIPSEPIYWDDQTREIVTDYIKLRYKLLPYNYSLSYLNTTTGRPLVLPVNYFEPGNQRLKNVNDEYLWGKDILIAPVLVKGDTVRKVLFPKGRWTSWWNNLSYKDSAIIDAPLNRLPIFIRSASFIPQTDAITHTELYNAKNLTLICTEAEPNERGSFKWYYDNGTDPKALEKGNYELVEFTSSRVGKKQVIRIIPLHVKPGTHQHFNLNIQYRKGSRVRFSRKLLYILINKEIPGIANANPSDNSTVISFNWDGKPLRITY